jgi:hypothetical protein
MHMMVNITSDGLDASRDQHGPVIEMKSYGEKAYFPHPKFCKSVASRSSCTIFEALGLL